MSLCQGVHLCAQVPKGSRGIGSLKFQAVVRHPDRC